MSQRQSDTKAVWPECWLTLRQYDKGRMAEGKMTKAEWRPPGKEKPWFSFHGLGEEGRGEWDFVTVKAPSLFTFSVSLSSPCTTSKQGYNRKEIKEKRRGEWEFLLSFFDSGAMFSSPTPTVIDLARRRRTIPKVQVLFQKVLHSTTYACHICSYKYSYGL